MSDQLFEQLVSKCGDYQRAKKNILEIVAQLTGIPLVEATSKPPQEAGHSKRSLDRALKILSFHKTANNTRAVIKVTDKRTNKTSKFGVIVSDIICYLVQHPKRTTSQISKALHWEAKHVSNSLVTLREKNLLIREGVPGTSLWYSIDTDQLCEIFGP